MLVGVNVAVIRDGRILLTQREDFHVWCLPGGHAEDGETLPQAALREVREELDLPVRLDALVGIYSRPNWKRGYHIALFAGTLTDPDARPTLDPHEVLAAEWFAADALPQLLIGQRQRIADAFAGVRGVMRRSDVGYPADLPADRLALYAARDRSGLAPAEYYARHFGPLDVDPIAELPTA